MLGARPAEGALVVDALQRAAAASVRVAVAAASVRVAVTFIEAAAICSNAGARLCTAAELRADYTSARAAATTGT